MLSRIFIQNFALIDRLEIHLEKGLQVITGETGAGKSIILGALRLILGERADAKSIVHSGAKSIVEAEFQISEALEPFFEENDLDFESDTIIRREILASGKSRAFVNHVPVTLDLLKKLSSRLIDIHSQFETSNLFSEDYQFGMLDSFSENKSLLLEYQSEYFAYVKLRRELDALKTRLSEGGREQDYKNFLLAELKEAQLDDINFEELQSQLSVQENAGSISELLYEVLGRMDQDGLGVLDQLAEVRTKLGRTAELSHHFSEIKDRFDSLYLEFKDFVFEIQNEAEQVQIDSELLATLNGKMNTLNSLFLKHNVNTVEKLTDIREALEEETTGFGDLETEIAKVETSLRRREAALETLSQKLSANRKNSSPVFTKKIEALLAQLGLEKAKIEVQLQPSPHFGMFGKEHIGIGFQANSGFPLKPIQSAISGGERSRVMLAVKKIMAESAELPTLVLDEIDTGVSGKVADGMGKVMKEMAEDMQLIVITHLAQVAAKGSNNYKVVKQDVSGKTQSTILPLSEAEKLQEIAQLLSGAQITAAALQQAEELMK